MAWANQKTITHLESLPEESLKAFMTNTDWHVAEIIHHIVDKALFDSVKLDDIQIEFENYEGKLVKRWRSTILSQSIHHATEHRAQIASALESKGFTPVDLDELDLWAYEKELADMTGAQSSSMKSNC